MSSPAPLSPLSVNKVLIVSLDNLGDCVMATSFLKPLRQFNPQIFIGLWVKEYACDLFSASSLINKVHAADPFWDKSPGLPKGSFWKFFRSWQEIRKEEYDLAFVINADWRRSLLCLLGGVPIRVGFDQKKSRFFLTKTIPNYSKRQHVVDNHQQLFANVWEGNPLPEFCPFLQISPSHQGWIDQWKKNHSLNEKIIVLHPFSGDKERNWPLANWVDLIHLINDNVHDVQIIIICSNLEEKLFGNKFPHASNIEIWAGQPLSIIKSILSTAQVFIGADSGPGHMAAALGTPVISLFNQKKFDISSPRGKGIVKVLYAEKYMGLGPLVVLHEVLELLGGTKIHGPI